LQTTLTEVESGRLIPPEAHNMAKYYDVCVVTLDDGSRCYTVYLGSLPHITEALILHPPYPLRHRDVLMKFIKELRLA
jgi:hypothetical protein